MVTIRPFNTYGPRQSTRAVIPTIIIQALRGDVVRLGSLTPTRDLNFVTDTVDGFVRAGQRARGRGPPHEPRPRRGDDDRRPRREDRRASSGARSGSRRTPSRLRPEASEVLRLRGDSSLARELLGWSPAVPLDEGLRRTVAWVRENLDAYAGDGYQV